MGFNRGHFFSALAGLIAGALLIGALPGLASNGDVMLIGTKNNAQLPTKLVSKGGLVLVVGRPGNSALTLNVVGTAPPMAVNSTGLVDNLNADLLDGRHGSYYRDATNVNSGTLSTDRFDAWMGLWDSGRLDNDHWADVLTRTQADDRYINENDASGLVRVAFASTEDVDEATVFDNSSRGYGRLLQTEIQAPTSGYLLIVGGADSSLNGSAWDYYKCYVAAGNSILDGSERGVNLNDAGNPFQNCATNGVAVVSSGTVIVDLYVEDRNLSGSQAMFGEASLQILFVPFGPDGSQP